MTDFKIPRLHGRKSPKRLLNKDLMDFVKVEENHNIILKPAEEFTLYVLRLYFNGYSTSQGAFGDIMGVSANRFSTYVNALQDKGYVEILYKSQGRSKMYNLLREPNNHWYKIPKTFIRDSDIDWKDRLFNINFYNLILEAVNEIHYTDAKIASLLAISMPTFRLYRNALLEYDIIESIAKSNTNKNGGYRVDVNALLGLSISANSIKPVHYISSYKNSLNRAT